MGGKKIFGRFISVLPWTWNPRVSIFKRAFYEYTLLYKKVSHTSTITLHYKFQ